MRLFDSHSKQHSIMDYEGEVLLQFSLNFTRIYTNYYLYVVDQEYASTSST